MKFKTTSTKTTRWPTPSTAAGPIYTLPEALPGTVSGGVRAGIIDSHCHISSLWYEPVESLLFQMERNGVDRAVLIQMFGQFDNREILDASHRFPGRFAPVVMVDTADSHATGVLRQLVQEGARGVRLEATSRSPGEDSLAIWRCAAELRLAVSCNGNTADYLNAHFQEILEAFPELPIVIEHLGRDSGSPVGIEDEADDFDALLELARHPSLTLRFHGLGEILYRQARFEGQSTPFVPAERDRLLNAVSAFGPDRMMWGSDHPPVSAREGYRNAMTLPRNVLARLGDDALARLFESTAARIFFGD
ncbi:MAG: amidohydrolase [Thermomicrobiales bacterium]|nr:amidohydrolase [Thermomicrobiales bacterium]